MNNPMNNPETQSMTQFSDELIYDDSLPRYSTVTDLAKLRG